MGERLHDIVLTDNGTRCRIYAPVGAHRDLLAYLVRRLLENGANSSFVNQIVDEEVPPEAGRGLPADGDGRDGAGGQPRHPDRPRPVRAAPQCAGVRSDRRGRPCGDRGGARCPIARRCSTRAPPCWPGRGGRAADGDEPGDGRGRWAMCCPPPRPMSPPPCAAQPWDAAAPSGPRCCAAPPTFTRRVRRDLRPAGARGGQDAGRCGGELREAVDFLRYYAARPRLLTAPARGVFACISPWNFPLAIFTGQIAAALAAGNAVLAKPAPNRRR
jgi:RHH-type transcriptional regulator, proline utilization regulon repressor / proline dehydrogenase / delta 1-pyrroline-5-carboxylate dehydrogenase